MLELIILGGMNGNDGCGRYDDDEMMFLLYEMFPIVGHGLTTERKSRHLNDQYR